MMEPQLYKHVMLNRDFPEYKLKSGDIAMYIDYLPVPEGEAGVILEVFNALGESIDVVTVPFSAIEPLRAEHVPSVRVMESFG